MSALRSPGAQSDRFQLDRLAAELAARESAKAGPSSPRLNGHASPPPPEIHTYVPLSHTDPHLSAPTFDVERFLLSRVADASLHDVRAELGGYLAGLREELVRLINDEYEAFISLSTDLRGEGARLERLRHPLADLKGRITVTTQWPMGSISISTFCRSRGTS